MEYSLQDLNINTKLINIKSSEIINKLNLIGFEIDEIHKENYEENKFFTNIRLVIKLPANRDDLISNVVFLAELSMLLKVKLYQRKKNLEKSYIFILKQKYREYKDYTFYKKNSNIENFFVYNIELKYSETYFSPRWLQKKLRFSKIKPSENFTDFLSLVTLEWNQNFTSFSLNLENRNKKNIFSIYNFETKEIFPFSKDIIDKNNKLINIESLPLKQISTKNEAINKKRKSFLQGIFYDSTIENQDSFLNLKYLKKQFLQNFRFSFQRLLTLLELSYGIQMIPTIYAITNEAHKNKNLRLKTTKILKVKKNSSKTFLNLESYNISLFQEAGVKLACMSLNFFYFEIPIVRKDLSREIDLIEEYCRFFEYENFEELAPLKNFRYYNKKGQTLKFTKQFFLNYGFNEILATPIQNISKNNNSFVIINNPLRADLSFLRKDLITKLFSIFQTNLRLGFEGKNFFEIGRVFKLRNKKIYETNKLAGIFQLKEKKQHKEFLTEWFEAKALIEKYLKNFGLKNLLFKQSKFFSSSFHQKKSLTILSENKIIGVFGEINPRFHNILNSKFTTFIFEFDLKNFHDSNLYSKIVPVKELSKYPTIKKDLSILVLKTTNFGKLKKYIFDISSNIKSVQFFDIYWNKKFPLTVSIGIRLEFQSFYKTLQNQEIEKEIKTIIKNLATDFNVILK